MIKDLGAISHENEDQYIKENKFLIGKIEEFSEILHLNVNINEI